jgi:hypothetical protein
MHYLMEWRFHFFFQGAVIMTFVGKNVHTFVQNENILDYPLDLDICMGKRMF